MRLRLFWALLALVLWGCARAGGYSVNVTYANLSDSYVYPYRVLINGKYGAPVAELLRCSNSFGLGGLVEMVAQKPPRFVTVEWENLLHRRAYRAQIDLSDVGVKWWKLSPFHDKSGRPLGRPPVLVIEWRTQNRVAAILAADSMGYDKGRLDLGEAKGVEIPRPKGGVRLYRTYDDLFGKKGDFYYPGTVYNYERRRDGNLSQQQRFGCPRLPNGKVDEERLPRMKLPFMVGENGEHIPCEEFFCADKQEVRERLIKMGFKTYPEGQRSPPPAFRDAPVARPAW